MADWPTLLPCPFCGGAAESSMGETGDGKPWPYIKCGECSAAVEPHIWNRRTLALATEPNWQAECERIYRETGGVTAKLREAYEWYKSIAPAVEKPATPKPDFEEEALRQAEIDGMLGSAGIVYCLKRFGERMYALGLAASGPQVE